MTQHTPGPWRAIFRANQKGMRRAFVKMGRDGFWELHKFESINEIDKANAHLIATAPEQHGALKTIERLALDALNSPGTESGALLQIAGISARAIAKATP